MLDPLEFFEKFPSNLLICRGILRSFCAGGINLVLLPLWVWGVSINGGSVIFCPGGFHDGIEDDGFQRHRVELIGVKPGVHNLLEMWNPFGKGKKF